MKKFLFSALVALMAAIIPSFAQNADRIVGEYDAVQGGDPYKVRVTKNSDGTYKAQIFWVKNTTDPKTGQKRLDPKNPNKSLRNVPCDQIVLFNGLSYNAEKKNKCGKCKKNNLYCIASVHIFLFVCYILSTFDFFFSR